MRQSTKYQPAAPRRSAWSGFLWLLVLLGGGLLVWIWLSLAKTTSAEKIPPAVQTPPIAPAPLPPPPPPPPTNRVIANVLTNRPAAPDPLPRLETDLTPRPVQSVFEAQIALARQGISAGSIDGAIGSQTRAALRAWQHRENLSVTGELDAATKSALLLTPPALTNYTVTSDDLARLLPLGGTWLEKSQQPRLDYETIIELLAEKGRAHPSLIRRLNPSLDWTNVVAGVVAQIPLVEPPPVRGRAAFVKIFLAEKILEAFDDQSNLVAHFPCSIAQRVEKRPVGELHVAVLAHNPNYTFNPAVFPESAEARQLGRKLIIAPGPNNPVGVAWIGLDLPGSGIHGTPRPEDVGRTESHGCFRLANWNAEFLLRLVSVGTPVLVEP